MNWETSCVLITGGTGSFGKKFVEILISEYHPKRLIIFSRDELKQHDMMVGGFTHPNIRYFIGDVRDYSRLKRAFQKVDIVVHAAALKQVPSCEYNPIEAVNTNINGARNIIDAALDCGVSKVLALSSDKATAPINLYGATKLVSEKLFVQANAYSGSKNTRFSCVRYGNVVGSRGSVVPLFKEQSKTGKITITDARMTRFWLTLEQGVRFVISSINMMSGGEVFIPKIPSMKIVDLARVISPECEIEYIGIRPGEKIHESLISEYESQNALEVEDRYIIYPSYGDIKKPKNSSGKSLPDNFSYSSNTNDQWLTDNELMEIL